MMINYQKYITLGLFSTFGLYILFSLANLLSKPALNFDPNIVQSDPYFEKVKPILVNKCVNCHTSQTVYPIYYQLPGANFIINGDTKKALEEYDMYPMLAKGDFKFTEDVLSKMEVVTAKGSMPPVRYRVFHWDQTLTEQDKQVIRSWIRHERSTRAETRGVKLLDEPIQPIPLVIAPEKINLEKIELGEKLFHDKRLSANNTISCASCHSVGTGGTDKKQFSTGIYGQTGQMNAPTVLNSVYNFVQFWDGRAADLAEQVDGPVNNHLEMGANWSQVIAKLKEDSYYQKMFGRQYNSGITSRNIMNAIAVYETALITPNSRFDQYLRGDKQALTTEEKEGYSLFKKVGCTACHMGVSIGGMDFETFGKFGNYFQDRKQSTSKEDLGRYNVSGLESDRFQFKVPSLRNVAETWPYFHDGSVRDLKEAVKIMAKYQNGETLSEREADLIVQFLRTLTGEFPKSKSE